MSDQFNPAKTLPLDAIKNRAQVEAAPVHSTIRMKPGAHLRLEQARFLTIPVSPEGQNPPSYFELVDQLGEGGAGVVYLARQSTLNRDVALKSPLSAELDSPDVHVLLREAHIMGYLEHPGIVPIHLVARDADQKPYVVMKRIEGRTLEDRLEGTEDVLEQLDENLDVLIDVCHALSYAHSRGIVHRDIKPSNIMTGAFGEVYLLDWGIAVAYRDDVPATIPRAAADELVGTPSYMAPEMASLEGAHGPRTDVYLMGALLYSILTGEAPHQGGSSPWAALFQAQQSEPKTFPDAVPPALAEICNRAMSRDPADRYASVDAFRQALVDVREHEAAQELANSGAKQVEQLHRALARDEVEEAEVHALFGAARQTLEESLRLWPECTNARLALQAALERVIDFELGRNNALGAQRLVDDLPRPNPELAERVEQAVAEHRNRENEIEQLRREMDPRVAGRAKAMMWFGIGLAIAVPQLLPIMLGSEPTAQSLAVDQAILIAVLAVLCVVFRSRLFSTRLNRSLTTAVWMPVLLALLLRLGVLFGHGSIAYALAVDLGFVAMVGLYIAINIDSRVAFAVPGYVAGACAAIAYPAYAAWIFPLTHLLSMTLLGVHSLLDHSD